MDDIQTVANERDNLMQILAAVRVALRVPDDVDIVAHAQAVAAAAARWDGVPWDALDQLLYNTVLIVPHLPEFQALNKWYESFGPDGAA